MKQKLIFALFFLILSTNYLYSQDNKYFDTPFGGGGGFVGGWHIPNVEPINKMIIGIGWPEYATFKKPELSTSGMFTTGGAGFIYIGFVKNLRLGGIGYGGTISSATKNSDENLEAIFSIGGGGLTVEYTLPFVKNIGLSVGATLGGGSLSVEFYKNNGNFRWDDFLGNENNVSRKIESSFWMVSPTINAEIPVYRFVAFRLGGGYQLTFAGDWEAENGQSISGIPSDLNADGFFIQAGIFVGFFSF